MASATDPSRPEPRDAGTNDAATLCNAPPRLDMILDAVIAIAVTITSFLFLVRPLEMQRPVIIGASDRSITTGFHEAELDQMEGRPFRWTTAEATVRIPAQGVTDHLLTLRLAAPTGIAPSMPQAVGVDLNRAHLATLPVLPMPRIYRLLAPHHQIRIAGNDITLRTTTTRIPDDRRDLGVAAFAVTFAALNETDWLPPIQAIAVSSAALLLLIALRMLDVGALRWIVVALFAAISLSMRHSDLRFAQRWEALLLTSGLVVIFALAIPVIRQWKGKSNTSSACATRQISSQATQRIVQASTQPSQSFELPRFAFYLLLAGFAAMFAILLFAPLIPEPSHFIPGPPGDNLEYVWKLRWFADALVQRQSPTFVPHLFYPNGHELALSELTPAHTLLGLPLTLLTGPTLTHNILIVASFTLTTLFTALLAERLGAGRLGAFVAGIGVGFCLWRYQHTLGQINMIGTQWVVLAFYGLEGFIRRRHAFDAALTGTGVALASWSSWYYGPTLWLLMALWLLLRQSWQETRSLLWTAGPAALAVPLVGLALLAPYAQPTFQTLHGGNTRHDYASLQSLSARPLDYLTPSRYHAIWGAWSAQIAPDTAGAQLVAPGFALLILAGIGVWRRRQSTVTRMLLIIGGVCFVMSLGPELRLGDQTIPLPAFLAYEHIPGLRSIRAWSRMAFYVQICIGLLASLSLTGFAQQPRMRQMIGLIMVCGVLLETFHRTPWSTSTLPRPVDRWLAAQPGSGATLQVPDLFSGAVEYATLFSQRPSLTGYGTFLPAGATNDMAWMREFPFPRAITTIRRLGGEYVLAHRSAMDRELPGWRERAAQRPELLQVYEDNEFTVYRIVTGTQP
ncbi:MAG: hypothetical protein ACUVSW_04370 [Roseiflexus sp.]